MCGQSNLGDPHARESRLLPGWSVQKAKSIGADAVKLLVYYHPESPHARAIEELVETVAPATVVAHL